MSFPAVHRQASGRFVAIERVQQSPRSRDVIPNPCCSPLEVHGMKTRSCVCFAASTQIAGREHERGRAKSRAESNQDLSIELAWGPTVDRF